MRHSFRRRHAAFVAAALVLAAPSAARAQNRTPVIFAGAPEAKWIAPPGMHADSFGVFHARRTLELGARPARFVVHV